ncbi:MAG: sigma-54-dependent Fis family transcriptional regulator [Rhodospirillaceae bacterium]|jgi:DNA-binding NtrC family response regulator|nr:sigma-54-dependent Fis family transcriptional regulator [Rhodospirillaceae bacterium]|tara:strand:+ start:1434 stop:2786 length:1353 start_codon:yes stop_codon:yes gene_type:complete
MRLLIVGTLEGQIGAASQIAIQRGARVEQVDTTDAGLRALRRGQGADLVMIDVMLDIGGFIKSLELERISLPVVACGIGNDTKAAVRAIRAGAKEYVPLPPGMDLIATVLEAVVEENHAIVHKDPKMAEILKLAARVAPSDATILITGASGTGKELIARLVHAKSGRKGGKFIAINCAAIPENLLESELFGHEKGAFTGAVARRLGKFEEASGGTLLLDEISEMDPHLQAKLLRAIEEKEIGRVGGSKPIPVDVRIVATSNRNIEDEVAKGNFREDLYFRLNVMNLKIPALNERPGDIPVLAEHFVAKYAEANGIPALPITREVMKRLAGYTWPGNVRELENAMHRAVLLSTADEIESRAIILGGIEGGGNGTPPAVDGEDGSTAALVGRTVADVERELIIDTLQHCLGNRTHAANILGISIRTLRNKLKQYGERGYAVPTPGEAERPAA